MSNFFEDALQDADKLEQELLGPDYDYYKFVKTPSEMGMGSKAKDLIPNFKGIAGYFDVLLMGDGNGQHGKDALGDKFFLATGAKCKDQHSNEDVTRSLYINNQPDGAIDFLSGSSVSPLGSENVMPKGLIPGILTNIEQINPIKLFTALMSGSDPACQSIEMETIDENGQKKTETGFVTNSDILSMNPCWFNDKVNPVTKAKCEGFTTMKSQKLSPASVKPKSNMPNDDLIKIYYSALGLLGIYILFKCFEKKK